MAADIGVDRLCWELTDHPEDMFSRRFVPGSPDLAAIKREVWDDSNLGNAIPGATPQAQIEVRQSGALARRSADLGPAGDGSTGPSGAARRDDHESLDPPLPAQASYGRRLVRLGAQLCDRESARSSIATSNGPGCPRRCGPAQSIDVPMTLTAPATPGRYALKFDLVSEGIDWFEACGSQTTTKTLIVV